MKKNCVRIFQMRIKQNSLYCIIKEQYANKLSLLQVQKLLHTVYTNLNAFKVLIRALTKYS